MSVQKTPRTATMYHSPSSIIVRRWQLLQLCTSYVSLVGLDVLPPPGDVPFSSCFCRVCVLSSRACLGRSLSSLRALACFANRIPVVFKYLFISSFRLPAYTTWLPSVFRRAHTRLTPLSSFFFFVVWVVAHPRSFVRWLVCSLVCSLVLFFTQATGNGSALPWQSNDDIPSRKEILGKIVTYLQQRKPQARPEWIQKVPLMAKRLEDSLYRTARSFEEYKDHTTLRARLQQLAARLGTNAQQRNKVNMRYSSTPSLRVCTLVCSPAT